jgi:hypothetical protein
LLDLVPQHLNPLLTLGCRDLTSRSGNLSSGMTPLQLGQHFLAALQPCSQLSRLGFSRGVTTAIFIGVELQHCDSLFSESRFLIDPRKLAGDAIKM